MTQAIPLETLLKKPSTVVLRPRYEGSNICTWIGFKHVNYLVEEALLEHFRSSGLSARRLYEEYGLGLDVIDLDTRILNAFHLDDAGVAEVMPVSSVGPTSLTFAVTVTREGLTGKDVTSSVQVALRRDTYVDPTNHVPVELTRFAVDRLGNGHVDPIVAVAGGAGTDVDWVLERLTKGLNAVGWKWRIAYPYCHFNERLQMSGYLRLMEEAVDRLLSSRGISIKSMLDDRRWIPVVPHSRIRILDEAMMEEDLYTVISVDEIFKDLTYRSTVNTYVLRDGEAVQTSTGTITHGYALIANRRDWRLVNFDDHVLAALRGEVSHE